MPATACGEEERLAARRGKAEMTTPSPKLDRVEAASKRLKGDLIVGSMRPTTPPGL
jgi:hypothetical protein